MFKNLLIALDGSELANKALAAGLEVAKKHGSSVIILTSTDPISTGIGSGGFGTLDAGPIIERLEEAYAAEARKILDAARQKAVEAGVDAETIHMPRHRPADGIIQTVEERGCDAVIMGSNSRRGLERLLLGSQAAAVLARSKVPVLIVK